MERRALETTSTRLRLACRGLQTIETSCSPCRSRRGPIETEGSAVMRPSAANSQIVPASASNAPQAVPFDPEERGISPAGPGRRRPEPFEKSSPRASAWPVRRRRTAREGIDDRREETVVSWRRSRIAVLDPGLADDVALDLERPGLGQREAQGEGIDEGFLAEPRRRPPWPRRPKAVRATVAAERMRRVMVARPYSRIKAEDE
ncbi:MAG: hypothetical protein MZV70_29490 [Desulfobacterales bacterium]|nr:hypothetical protein [Desulfobacterales bacterium]